MILALTGVGESTKYATGPAIRFLSGDRHFSLRRNSDHRRRFGVAHFDKGAQQQDMGKRLLGHEIIYRDVKPIPAV